MLYICLLLYNLHIQEHIFLYLLLEQEGKTFAQLSHTLGPDKPDKYNHFHTLFECSSQV